MSEQHVEYRVTAAGNVLYEGENSNRAWVALANWDRAVADQSEWGQIEERTVTLGPWRPQDRFRVAARAEASRA